MNTIQSLYDIAAYCPYHFVPPSDDDGLVGLGGDLQVPTLLQAYLEGCFPWFDAPDAIAWWCPNPRCVLVPDTFVPKKSLVRNLKRQSDWYLCLNHDFKSVIHACSLPRVYSCDTWIHQSMKDAYQSLHHIGAAFSLEVYERHALIGGLYGVKIGSVVFGESMFYTKTDASKAAFWALAKYCQDTKVPLIDCQLPNSHLFSLGATLMARTDFLDTLKELTAPTKINEQCHEIWQNTWRRPLSWLLD